MESGPRASRILIPKVARVVVTAFAAALLYFAYTWVIDFLFLRYPSPPGSLQFANALRWLRIIPSGPGLLLVSIVSPQLVFFSLPRILVVSGVSFTSAVAALMAALPRYWWVIAIVSVPIAIVSTYLGMALMFLRIVPGID